eukprot:CAMPEP_0202705796 /NCGR_PEP_ID=MMETSP1385-20130828/18310_1 /ASSEMBLY_ACC=CAM_ASM_000861 /TAXON_ID=933848 /ORGANISM="Elphidium margaritaceum" /LENGTH=61 /DNA_ID=CAMNT_0049364115 /DNA_START=1 /DNA_END=186 /DNA_ORIENTATION=-
MIDNNKSRSLISFLRMLLDENVLGVADGISDGVVVGSGDGSAVGSFVGIRGSNEEILISQI